MAIETIKLHQMVTPRQEPRPTDPENDPLIKAMVRAKHDADVSKKSGSWWRAQKDIRHPLHGIGTMFQAGFVEPFFGMRARNAEEAKNKAMQGALAEQFTDPSMLTLATANPTAAAGVAMNRETAQIAADRAAKREDQVYGRKKKDALELLRERAKHRLDLEKTKQAGKSQWVETKVKNPDGSETLMLRHKQTNEVKPLVTGQQAQAELNEAQAQKMAPKIAKELHKTAPKHTDPETAVSQKKLLDERAKLWARWEASHPEDVARAKRSYKRFNQKSGRLLKNIGRAIKFLQDPKNMNNVFDKKTGLFGMALKQVPGTAAYTLSELLAPLKARLAFSELQDMREASKTGGAIGQVSNYEQRMLASATASLDQGVSDPKMLTENLLIVYQEISKARQIASESFGDRWGAPKGAQVTAPASQQQVPAGADRVWTPNGFVKREK